MQASNGLPSSKDVPPRFRPNRPSHSDGCLEQTMNIQINGSQSAPVTFGRCRISRRKRKITTQIVRSSATCGGISPTARIGCNIIDILCKRSRGISSNSYSQWLGFTLDEIHSRTNHIFNHLCSHFWVDGE